MNPFWTVFCVVLIFNISSNAVDFKSSKPENEKNGFSYISPSVRRHERNTTQNVFSSRQILGYEYEDVKYILGKVFSFFQYGFNFVTDKVSVMVRSSMKKKKKDKVSYKGFQVLRIDPLDKVTN